jgi:hypothetical protein
MASVYRKRLGTRITDPVDDRLRMLVLLKGESLSCVLDSLLDEKLPAADVLATALLRRNSGYPARRLRREPAA